MKNVARRLMSGASFAVLAFGGLPAQTARASSGRTINNETAAVTVNAGSTPDYILVTNDGDVAGNVVNNGAIGPDNSRGYGIRVHSSSSFPDSSAIVRGNITNNNLIKVTAASTNRARGIEISGVGGHLLGNVINAKSANITVVDKHAGATVTVTATGVRHVIQSAATAKMGVINDGHINVLASASATHPDAFAHGIVEQELGVANFNNHLINDGEILVTAIAHDVSGTAIAIANDVGQHGIGSSPSISISVANLALGAVDPHNFITNNGTMNALAKATGVANAVATANPITQQLVGVGVAGNSAQNHGAVNAFAKAHATTSAIAHATGIRQRATNVASVSNTVDNFAKIGAFGSAQGSTAHAHATGVAQTAHGVTGTANQNVNNTGHKGTGNKHVPGDILAVGIAIGDTHAHASANAIKQHVTTASIAKNNVKNSGLAIGVALATGEFAHANAVGVGQYVHNATVTATNKIHNSGGIGAFAGAGTGLFHVLSTHALLATAQAKGAVQFVGGPGFTNVDTARNSFVNTHHGPALNASSALPFVSIPVQGLVYAQARASAFGDAKATATGVSQHIGSATHSAKNHLANSGTIEGLATAGAFFTATAKALGVHQAAAGSTFAQVATALNQLTNTGHLFAHAKASALKFADATAKGVVQSIHFADPGTNVVHNAAKHTISATAKASAPSANAIAVAVSQNQHDVATALNSVTNAGLIYAKASAVGETASAVAVGVAQSLTEVVKGKNFVSNKAVGSKTPVASIHAIASAHGKGTANDESSVSAQAYGVAQKIGIGSSNTFLTSARNSVVNHGNIYATAHANLAKSGFASHAAATAYGVRQAASASTLAKNFVSNDGVIRGKATATAENADATAYGVRQFASAATASNIVVNQVSDTIRGHAKASATGTGTSDGHAFALARGIRQHVGPTSGTTPSVQNALNSVKNFGNVFATASAHAVKKADATATGVRQYGLATSLTDSGVAKNVISNHGHITALATAKGESASAYARGIYQFAAATIANNTVKNSDQIMARAKATATGTGGSGATALAQGIHQHISSASSGATPVHAVNSVQNHGNVFATAIANAKDDAIATASGISQKAIASRNFSVVTSTTAKNVVSNDGKVSAWATAVGESAHAHARGVNQSARAEQASNIVVNQVSDTILAHAKATGSAAGTDTENRAAAQAIRQHITGTASNAVSNALNSVMNHGNIFATAHGKAPSRAMKATATGVVQTAFAVVTAKNAVVNDGHISAKATVVTAATALARAKGITQSARATTATNFVSNLAAGTIKAHAFVTATGTKTTNDSPGKAQAVGVRQSIVQSSAIVDKALNSVKNHGHVFASALATDVDESARATATGIKQVANATFLAHNFVSNAGVVLAFAKASGEEGFARATGVNQNAHATTGGFSSAGAKNTVHNAAAGSIKAHAIATGTNSNAGAVARAIQQSALAATSTERLASNSVTNAGKILATAHAKGSSSSSARATASGIHQFARAGDASNFVSNNGNVSAIATAIAGRANAAADGIVQFATAGGSPSNKIVNNSGDVIHAHALATATSLVQTGSGAHATAHAIRQHANTLVTTETAVNHVTNASGTINATATAIGKDKRAFARGFGVSQSANAHNAQNFLSNEGIITAKAKATGTLATAFADGVAQFAVGHRANNSLTNHGSIKAVATAHASEGHAEASASAVRQTADRTTGLAFNHLSNTSDISAVAHAHGITGANRASAVAVRQFASAGGATGSLSLAASNHAINTTGGDIHALATAHANQPSLTGKAAVDATANAFGIRQHVIAGSASHTANGLQQAVNDGTIAVTASAFANAKNVAVVKAKARAVGISQSYFAGGTGSGGVIHASVTNEGNITAHALASIKTGKFQTATATAAGVAVHGSADKLIANISNTGFISARATARPGFASGDIIVAHAKAAGIGVQNLDTDGVVSGTIANHGTVRASASAESGTAQAVGMGVQAHQFIGNIKNSGNVSAFAHGSKASATAIGVTALNPTGIAAASGTGNITNSGYVLASANGGPGWAIKVQNAPNEIDIHLNGSGVVHGNIGLQTGDDVTVANGTTFFDGTINPAPLGNVGNLTINSNGTLRLAIKPTSFWGTINAAAYVNSYNQQGTLELDVDGSGDNGHIGSLARPITGGVTLAGGVLMNPQPDLYPNSLVYRVVFGNNAGTRWSGVSGSTPFLQFAAAYPDPSVGPPSNLEADIVLTRCPFDAPCGGIALTPNEEAVADGLEHGYNTGLTGSAKTFYESIFGISASKYPRSLDMLSGEEAGEVAFVNVSTARDFIDAISERLDAEYAVSAIPGSASATPGKGMQVVAAQMGQDSKLWGEGFGKWETTKSTKSGPGYHTEDAGVALGWDTHVNNDLVLGIGGTYAPKATIHFKPFGTSVGATGTYTGFEVGGYGRYDDPNLFYLEGSASYGRYDDTTHRFVSLPNPTPPPTNNSGFVNGKFSSGVWAIYGEGGVPLDTGGDLRITPYAAVAYINSSSGSYQEHIQSKGMIGTLPSPVALHVSDASATSFSSYLGVQFGTNWALSNDTTLLPSLKLAWVHEFDSSMWQVNAAFPGVPGSGFTVNGAFLGKDSGLVDASVAVALSDNLAASFGYEGRLSSTTTDNMVLGRLTLTFGEEAPPPPPPAPPPPPPPPAPPPPPVKTFIVFFDFDKSNITAEADSVVSEAVKTAKEGGVVKLLITGHTDTVGSDSYNQGLSVRRANAVKSDMVQKGMDGSDIAIEGKSFHDPLVATGPGVREPQNRRAVIDLGG